MCGLRRFEVIKVILYEDYSKIYDFEKERDGDIFFFIIV